MIRISRTSSEKGIDRERMVGVEWGCSGARLGIGVVSSKGLTHLLSGKQHGSVAEVAE